GNVGAREEQEIIDVLERKKTDYVLLNPMPYPDFAPLEQLYPRLHAYLEDHYPAERVFRQRWTVMEVRRRRSVRPGHSSGLARAAGDRVAWLGLGLLLGFRLLAFPTWTIPNYTHWSLFFLIVGLWLLQGYPASRSRRRLLALGAAAGLGVVFKQNYGAIALAVAFVGVAALEPRPLR